MAGIEQEDAIVQQFLFGQPLAIVFALNQSRQHVAVGIAGLGAPPGHQPFEVEKEIFHRLVAAGEGVGANHRLQRTQDGQRPVSQGLALALGHVEQVADHLDWDRGGEIVDQVHLALGGDGVEQAVHQLDQIGLHAGDRARRERTHDQAADAGMGGGIVEDEARGVVLVEQGVAVFRRELLLLVG